NAHSEYTGFRAGLSQNYLFNEQFANTTTVFASGAATNSSSAAGWSENNPINYGFRSAFNFEFEIAPGYELMGTAGIEAQSQKSHPLSYSMVPDSTNLDGYNVIGNVRSNTIANTNNWFYFTQWTLAMPHGFSATAGLGVNNTNISLENRLNMEGENASYEAGYHNLISPHFALNKVFNEHLSLYASYSKAYRTPVSSNIVIGATGELNTDLRPEEGEQFQIGSKGDLLGGKLQYQMALFRAEFSNKMTSVAVALDSVTTAYTYLANSGGQIDKGLELLVKYRAYHSDVTFLENLHFWGNFTYSNFNYDDFGYQSIPRGETEVITEIYDGKAVAGVSPVKANVGMDFSTNNGFFGNIYYSYKDAMPITSNGKFSTEAFSLLNAKIGFHTHFLDHFDLELFAGAKNILENQYYTMVFINQLPDAYIPGPTGINIYEGIDLRYVF
ncbi:MAG TPA: TonB-dependent receptor, partial [Salinimicrobium sp.]|nr:TonB-dependent receptor [Salinimicrobium sp.]